MSLKVALVNSNKKNNQKIELRSELYFESGLPVEASDQKILLVRYKGISGLHDEDQSNDPRGCNCKNAESSQHQTP